MYTLSRGHLLAYRDLVRLKHGHGQQKDIELLRDICDNISGKSFCPLGDAATSSITSGIKLFREEFEYHVQHGHCMTGRVPVGI